MDITINMPALLFPAISLMLLAYTNRFTALAGLMRQLYHDYCGNHDPALRQQIHYFQSRIRLIREMQFLAVVSFFLCVLCMLLLVCGQQAAAAVVFIGSLVILLCSLGISLREIYMSAVSLNLQLGDFDRPTCRVAPPPAAGAADDPDGGI